MNLPITYNLGDIRTSQDWLFVCIQAHTVHPGQEVTHRPETFRAAWGIFHGTTKETARPFLRPLGVSGMYRQNDCYYWIPNGHVYQAINDVPTGHNHTELPSAWRDLGRRDGTGGGGDGGGGEPTPTYPRWADLPDGHMFNVGDRFTDYGKTYEVLRQFQRFAHFRPPALLNDFYREI